MRRATLLLLVGVSACFATPRFPVLMNSSQTEDTLRMHMAEGVAILYDSPAWPWCSSCAAMRNASVEAFGIIVDHFSERKEKRGKKPAAVPIHFAVADCSVALPGARDSPCGSVRVVPSLKFFRGSGETAAEWTYTSYSDALGVLQFLKAHHPGLVSVTPPLRWSADSVGRRNMPKTATSRLIRMSRSEAVGNVSELGHAVFMFYHEAECRSCSAAYISSEGLAQTQKVDYTGDVLFARVVADETSRTAWQLEIHASPLILLLLPQHPLPVPYRGPLQALQLALWVRYWTRNSNVMLPVGTSPDPISVPHAHVIITQQQFDETLASNAGTGRRTLVAVHAPWESPTITADFITAFRDVASICRRECPTTLVVADLGVRDSAPLGLDSRIPRLPPPFVLEINDGIDVDPVAHTVGADGARLSLARLANVPWSHPYFVLTENTAAASDGSPVVGPLYHLETLDPLLGSGPEDWNGMSLPFNLYEDLHGLFILVHYSSGLAKVSSTAQASSLVENTRRATIAFRAAARRFMRHAAETFPRPNVSFGIIDAALHSVVATFDPHRTASSASPAVEPFVLHLIRDIDSVVFNARVLQFSLRGKYNRTTIRLSGDGVASLSDFRMPLDAHALGITDAMLLAHELPERYDKHVTEFTANSLISTVLDPSYGTLLLLYSGGGCPHSAAILPTFGRVGLAFQNDSHQIVIGQVDVDGLDSRTRDALDIKYFPQIRWYPRELGKTLGGEVYDSTPFKESLIEFVSEEMKLPHVDLYAAHEPDEPFSQVTYKDLLPRILDHEHGNQVVYFVNGRQLSDTKLETLRRVGYHFGNYSEKFDAAQVKENLRSREDDHGTTSAKRAFGAPLAFYRVDAARYWKALRKAGIFVNKGELPFLAFLPAGTYKLTKIAKYPKDKTFAEISIARWVEEHMKLPLGFVDEKFTFTQAEIDSENDPPLFGVDDWDSSNFFDHLHARGDAVVMYYAQWCRYCKEYAPTFSKTAEHFAGDESIRFAKVDVPNNPNVGHHQGIQQFPTVFVYFEGSRLKKELRGLEYRGPQTVDGLAEFVSKIRGTSKVNAMDDLRESRVALVPQLTDVTFSAWMTAPEHALISFDAQWCGHCKQLSVVLADLVGLFSEAKMPIRIGRIDGEVFTNVSVDFNATIGFPVIVLFKKSLGQAKPEWFVYKNVRELYPLQQFIGEHIPECKLGNARIDSFDRRRQKEENELIESLLSDKPLDEKKVNGLSSSGQRSPKANPDSVAKRKKGLSSKDVRRSSPVGTVPIAGDSDDSENTPVAFRGWRKHVTLLNQDSFAPSIDGSQVRLVLYFGDGDEMVMNTFNDLGEVVSPAVKAGVFNVSAIDAAEFPTVHPMLGHPPSITLFRGYATPAAVTFGQGSRYADDGDGGSMTNLTHLLAFVGKHLQGASERSLELSARTYDKATSNKTMTIGIFFYAPWCDECRESARQWDDAAQSLGHVEHVLLTRVDISRFPGPYAALGEKPLPAIFVYDRVEGDGPRGKPRYFSTRRFPSRHDIVNFVQSRPTGPASTDNVGTHAPDFVDDGREYHAFGIPDPQQLEDTLKTYPRGVALLFVADWCLTCPHFVQEYRKLVPRLRQAIVVAMMDVTEYSAVLKSFNLNSVPSVVFVHHGPDGTQARTIVHHKGKKTTAAWLAFLERSMHDTSDSPLPWYPEVNTTLVAEEAVAADESMLKHEPLRSLVSTAALEESLGLASVDKPVVVFTVAPSCGAPCANTDLVAAAAASGMRDSAIVRFFRAEDDAARRHLKNYGLRSFPSVLVACGPGSDGAVLKPSVISGTELRRRRRTTHSSGGTTLRDADDAADMKNIVTLTALAVDDRCTSGQERADEVSVKEALQSLDGRQANVLRQVPWQELRNLRRESLGIFLHPASHRRCVDECNRLRQAWEDVARTLPKELRELRLATLDLESNPLIKQGFAKIGSPPPLIAFVPRNPEPADSSEADVVKHLVDHAVVYRRAASKEALLAFLEKEFRDDR